jgi:hypothetical protein
LLFMVIQLHPQWSNVFYYKKHQKLTCMLHEICKFQDILTNYFSDTADAHNVCILTSNSETFDRLEIVISECKDDGVDCRIRGMRLKSKNEISRPPVDWRWFDGIDHGLLAYRPAEQLFYRAVLLTRYA